MSWEIESMSFGCPLLYWGIILVWEAEVNCVSGQGICCTATYWGNLKSIVFDWVPVLQCCGLLSGDKGGRTRIVRLGEGTWIVRLLRYESLDDVAVRRILDSRVTLI